YLLKEEKEEQEELNKLQLEFELLNKRKILFENLNKAESEFNQLHQSTDIFTKRKKELEIYIDCRVNFSQLMTSQTSLHKEINQKSLQLKQLIEHLEKNKLSKAKLDEELKKIKIDYDQKEKLIAEAEELDSIISIRDSIKNKQILTARIEKGDLIINQQKIEYKQIHNTLQASQLNLSQLKEQLPNISELNNVKNFHIKQADLDRRLNEITTEIKTVSDEIKLLTDNFKNELKEQLPAVTDKYISNIKEKIAAEIKNLNSKKILLNDKLNHILAQEKLKQWADELVEGENCPLCGSKKHPQVLNLDDLDAKIKVIKQQQQSVEKETIRYNDLLSKIEKTEYKLNLLNNSLDSKTTERNQKENEIQIHQKSLSLDGLNLNSYKDKSLNLIEKAIIDAEKMIKKIEKDEKTINKTSTELAVCQKNIDKYTRVYQELKDQYTALDATIENEIKKLKRLSLEQFENESDDSLTKQSQKQQQQVQKAITDFDGITIELSTVQSEIDKIQGQEKTLTELLTEKNLLLNEVQNTLQDKLSDSNYTDIDVVDAVLSKNINELEENQIISDFETKLKIACQTFESLQKESNGKEFNQEMFLIIHAQMSNKELILKELSSKIGVIQSEIKNLKIDLESKKKLDNEYQQLIKRKNNIAILSKLFKGQGFVRYISSVYLQNLSEAANERFFKMTRQQLQLEITENPSSGAMDFQVRDFLNEGKTRSVKTLSGGQMFQASLSLALALADSVQNQIKASHKFFFLDEGFGSLDNESLHIVFEALKSLKNENRIVGVISHVESLKQEIDVHLQVTKNDQRGSLINYSWS
ncbi:MAG: SMC family ATPase, partial [Pseudomonadota bacterium]